MQSENNATATVSASGHDAPVLEVHDLTTQFDLRSGVVRAVDGVSFSVRGGECVGLVGESGCGKSTTGLSVMKLLPSVGQIAGGTISLNGRNLAPLSDDEMRKVRGNEVSMVFQDPMTSLNPTWTIGRQIAESVRLHKGATKKEALERAVEVLRLVGMPRPAERLGQYPHQLSGGMRQRVMIAIALACEPNLLIADEPTTALDVTIQAQILDLIDDLRERLNMAVLLITHDMGVIAARTNKVMVMYAGKVVEGGATDELFARMHHPYSEALFQSIPRLDQHRGRRLYSIPGAPPDLSSPPPGCRFAPRCRYATEECRDHEPTLSAAGLAGGAAAVTAAPVGVVASTGVDVDEHVFACFHPVHGGETQGAPQGTSAPEAVAQDSQVPLGTDALVGMIGVPLEVVDAFPVVTVGEAEERDRATHQEISAREVVLRLDHLEKEYSLHTGTFFRRSTATVKAVSDVSFVVRRGETFGLVGESGCGKTTIGRLVVALERPSAGAVHFEGEEVSALRGNELRRRRRDLQLMFQDPFASLDPRMTVQQIVREPLAIQRIGDRREQDERVAQLLSEVGLSPKAAGQHPHEFSGGQRQRIGLARALALNPKVIVADEPVSALDVSIQAQILNLMRSLQERHMLTYMVISHDLAVVKYLADTIGVMYLGKLVEIGPAEDVYSRAAHPYTQGLVDTIPIPDPAAAKRTRGAAMQGELPSPVSPPSGCRFRTRCPLAREECAVEEPALRAFGTGHFAACHFPLRTPSSDAPMTVGAGAGA